MIASDHEWIMSALERISIFEHNLITTIHSDGGQRACVSDDCRDIGETVRYMYWGAPAPFRRNTVKDLGEVPPSAVRAKICADNLSQVVRPFPIQLVNANPEHRTLACVKCATTFVVDHKAWGGVGT